LLQIYAPIEGNAEAFHRTLFLFCCKNGSCRNFKLIRAQLPRDNKFYTDEAHEDNITLKEDTDIKFAPECEFCGCSAPKRCGHCQYVNYCSREHQVEDWRIGHSEICKKIQAWKKEHGLERSVEKPKSLEMPKFPKYPSRFLFKEMEIITDLEPEKDAEKEIENEDKSAMMAKYNDYLQNWSNKDTRDLNNEFKSGHSDKTFAKFNRRISRDFEQVLRYCRSETAQPLWVATSGQATATDIPHCSLCGGERKFEFQILPQLLYYLGVEQEKEKTPLDWGTLVAFTCWNSCSIKEKGWAEEFLWVQDIV